MWKDLADPDFPLRGPKIAKEFFAALRASGPSLLQHHMAARQNRCVKDFVACVFELSFCCNNIINARRPRVDPAQTAA
eukprot:14895253-Heterocapsa_arctica.AAC.1